MVDTNRQCQAADVYRREACLYLSNHDPSNPILREVHSALGRKALIQESSVGNFCPFRSTDGTARTATASSEETNMLIPSSLIHCHGCGCHLKGSFRVETQWRSKTARRRASRQKSKERILNSKRRNEAVSNKNPLKQIFQTIDCSSVIKRTCQYCQNTRSYRGIPIVHQRKESKVMNKSWNFGYNRGLVSSASESYSKKMLSSHSNLALGVRKKKKTKQRTPKSDLMNFLSNLNNH